jgi:hypothetical protein
MKRIGLGVVIGALVFAVISGAALSATSAAIGPPTGPISAGYRERETLAP